MDVQSPIVRLSSLFLPPSNTSPQNNIQPNSPSPSSSTTVSTPSNPPPPFPAYPPPTSDEIDAVIQQATSSVSSDGRHVPLKDTRTQLFVGNVCSLFPFPISYSIAAELPLPLLDPSHCAPSVLH